MGERRRQSPLGYKLTYQLGEELLLQKLLTYFVYIVFIVPKHNVVYNFLQFPTIGILFSTIPVAVVVHQELRTPSEELEFIVRI